MDPSVLEIDEVIEAVVSSLRSIPGLVDILGNEAETGIRAYDTMEPPARNLAEAIEGMLEPSLLVVFTSFSEGRRGTMPAWKYGFALVVRVATAPERLRILKQIIDGVPAIGDGQRWLDTTIHPSCDPPENTTWSPTNDSEGLELWQLTFTLTAYNG